MTAQIIVPPLGESVTEATVARWLKNTGDVVCADEPVVELETDKVTVEVNAPINGVLSDIKAEKGRKVSIGEVLASLGEHEKASADITTVEPAPVEEYSIMETLSKIQKIVMPSARKLAAERGVDASAISGSGKGGRITKEDVITNAFASPSSQKEKRVKMTRIRQRTAERLKEAQNTAAILTTFNEVDMSAIASLRAASKERFETKYGVKLGIMSFFVKACTQALKENPIINSAVDGEDIVYKYNYDIGVAVGTDNALVVPVIKNADSLGFHDIERKVSDFAARARDGRIAMQELSGGTFTITNGGIYGSLMSTPILNPPQSAILGMHAIKDRPIAVDGRVEIRPMMYLALSYDHRIIDGREAVTFLFRVKELVENPARLLFEA